MIKAATLDVENQRNSNFVEWNPIKCNFVSINLKSFKYSIDIQTKTFRFLFTVGSWF